MAAAGAPPNQPPVPPMTPIKTIAHRPSPRGDWFLRTTPDSGFPGMEIILPKEALSQEKGSVLLNTRLVVHYGWQERTQVWLASDYKCIDNPVVPSAAPRPTPYPKGPPVKGAGPKGVKGGKPADGLGGFGDSGVQGYP
eukprot:gene8474-10553_t